LIDNALADKRRHELLPKKSRERKFSGTGLLWRLDTFVQTEPSKPCMPGHWSIASTDLLRICAKVRFNEVVMLRVSEGIGPHSG
jgi:hypothetical protein